jgi:DNA-directed RNA polymerase subunit F
MSNPQVTDKKSINMIALREKLAEIKKRDGELSLRGNKTEEYVNEFAMLKPKQAEELYKELEKLSIPRLKDSHINKIIDLMPSSVDELKVVMQGYTVPITNENLKKITETVAEYLPEKKKQASEKLAVLQSSALGTTKPKVSLVPENKSFLKKEEASKQKLAAPETQKPKDSEN